jgi:hypothetical protein
MTVVVVASTGNSKNNKTTADDNVCSTLAASSTSAAAVKDDDDDDDEEEFYDEQEHDDDDVDDDDDPVSSSYINDRRGRERRCSYSARKLKEASFLNASALVACVHQTSTEAIIHVKNTYSRTFQRDRRAWPSYSLFYLYLSSFSNPLIDVPIHYYVRERNGP